MSTIKAPVDPTTCPAWKALAEHKEALEEAGISLKDWFAADPNRVGKLSFATEALSENLRDTILK